MQISHQSCTVILSLDNKFCSVNIQWTIYGNTVGLSNSGSNFEIGQACSTRPIYIYF